MTPTTPSANEREVIYASGFEKAFTYSYASGDSEIEIVSILDSPACVFKETVDLSSRFLFRFPS